MLYKKTKGFDKYNTNRVRITGKLDKKPDFIKKAKKIINAGYFFKNPDVPSEVYKKVDKGMIQIYYNGKFVINAASNTIEAALNILKGDVSKW